MYYKISHGSVTLGNNTVLEDINFCVKDNEKIGIVGRNGCGKTTLLKAIVGEYEITSGTLEIEPNQNWEVSVPTATAAWFWIQDETQKVWTLRGGAGASRIVIGVAELDEFDDTRVCEVTLKMGGQSKVIATITRGTLERGFSLRTCKIDEYGDFEYGDSETGLTYSYNEGDSVPWRSRNSPWRRSGSPPRAGSLRGCCGKPARNSTGRRVATVPAVAASAARSRRRCGRCAVRGGGCRRRS